MRKEILENLRELLRDAEVKLHAKLKLKTKGFVVEELNTVYEFLFKEIEKESSK